VLTYSDDSPKVNEALSSALSGVNAKLRDLQNENGALRDASSKLNRQVQEKENGVRRLEAEKDREQQQHAALRKVRCLEWLGVL